MARKKKMNVLIIGAGEFGASLIEVLKGEESINIIGVVDTDPNAPGMRPAKKLGIRTGEDWKKFVNDESLDHIIDVTWKKGVYNAVSNAKPPRASLISGQSAKLMMLVCERQRLLDEKKHNLDIAYRKKAEEILNQTKKELEMQTWGLKKANEGIKHLYKEIAEKNRGLKKLDELKSDFVSAVSHELRTPLSITKEGISLVIDGIAGDVNERQERILKTARDNIDRLARIINDLLDISKIEAGKIELKREVIDMRDVIREVAAAFGAKLRTSGIDLKLDLPDEVLNVYADRDKLVQILMNLTGNAQKFTDAGHIEITARDKENGIEVMVADTGKGIEGNELEGIFSKFKQVGRLSESGGRGTGLGLTISKGLVVMHGGRIWIESEVGKGTKVIFRLPRFASDIFFEEYVENGIREAMEKDSNMSIIMFSLHLLGNTLESLAISKLEGVMKEMGDILNFNLRRAGDYALVGSRSIVVILSGCGSKDVVGIRERLGCVLEDYFKEKGMSQKARLRVGSATYPDDGLDKDELIDKARGVEHSLTP